MSMSRQESLDGNNNNNNNNATRGPPTKTSLQGRIEFTQSGIAQPAKNIFDPWNTASTGHQRAENRLSGSTSWRDSRNHKLSAQYHSGFTGGARISDSVGAGSENFGKDGRKANGGWEKGASGLRRYGQKSIQEAFAGTGSKFTRPPGAKDTLISEIVPLQTAPLVDQGEHEKTVDFEPPPSHQPANLRNLQSVDDQPPKVQIFQNLCVYINGTTGPLVSDHKLKYLLAQHGARMSIALGRRSVTHVILGNTHVKGGAGGGLAGTKIQKEISRVGGKGIKYVSVEWVLESIKVGKRLPEARFENLRLGGYNQGSVHGVFKVKKPTSSPDFGDKR